MIDKSFVSKIVNDLKKRRQGLGDHHFMHPEREWFSGLAIGLLILAGGLYWCLTIYWLYSHSSTNNAIQSPIQQSIYDVEMVNRALLEFSDRQQIYSSLKKELENNKQNETPSSFILIPNTDAETEEILPSNLSEVASTSTTTEAEMISDIFEPAAL